MCSIENCDKKIDARGLCHRHYENLRKYGNPIPQRDRDPAERFTESYVVADSGCWEWSGGLSDQGYGKVGWRDSPEEKAHRLSYIIYVGPIRQGLVVRHKCDNRCCVNPEHLELGTQADNAADMALRDRAKRETCIKGHPFSESRLVHRSNRRFPERVCRVCASERTIRWRNKNR